MMTKMIMEDFEKKTARKQQAFKKKRAREKGLANRLFAHKLKI